MVRCLLRPTGRGAAGAQRGFTLIEVMIAMAITITVMLANLYMINTAQKNLAYSRALTDATNLATNKIAEFKARVVTTQACYDAGTKDYNDMLRDFSFSGNNSPCGSGDINPDYPGLENEPFCSPAESVNSSYPLLAANQPAAAPICVAPGVRNPYFVSGGSAVGRTQTDATVKIGRASCRERV
jgi:type II secretory pathway pseudopilin PulG